MQKFKVLSSKKQRKADKSVRLIFPVALYDRMREAFGASEAISREGYAIAQCGYKVDGSHKNWDYMVRSLHIPGKEDLFEQSSITVTPKADFIEAILGDATEKNNAIMEIHTHVGSAEPNFSWVDIENGLENGRFLKSCGLRFAMAVVGSGGFSLCEYDADHDALQMPESARIGVIGRAGLKDVAIHRSSTSCGIPAKASPEGMRVAVAGLDGIGFAIVSMLVRQGVKDLVLFDEGVVDETSPDLLPYAPRAGKKKAKVARSMLKKIARDVNVSYVHEDDKNAKTALKDCDYIFMAGVDPTFKAVLNEASLKYFIPCIEASTLKKPGSGEPYGLVQVFMPSVTGCSICFDGAGHAKAEAPAGVLINAEIASIAVQEFMDIVACNEAADSHDLIEYDPVTQAIDRRAAGKNEACRMCGENGILGAGDEKKARKA